MKSPVWTKAIKACADPQRARHFLGLLVASAAGEALEKFSAAQARVLAALISGSQACWIRERLSSPAANKECATK